MTTGFTPQLVGYGSAVSLILATTSLPFPSTPCLSSSQMSIMHGFYLFLIKKLLHSCLS
jgi:hypothetical protein